MHSPSRGRRRHDRRRMIQKALRAFRTHDPRYPEASRPHDPEKLADNLAFCTCLGCRNPRRVFKGRDRLPFQEVRALAGLSLDE